MNTAVNILAVLLIAGIFALAIVRVREQNKIRGSLKNMRISHERFLALLGQLEGLIYRRNAVYPDANSVPLVSSFTVKITPRDDDSPYLSNWHGNNIHRAHSRPVSVCYIHRTDSGKRDQNQSHLENLWLQEDESAREILTAV